MSPVRRCSRTACGRPAVATLTYVYADSTAVLGPLATYAEPHCYDLCVAHSERLTAPRGWEVLRLAPDPADARADQRRPRGARRRGPRGGPARAAAPEPRAGRGRPPRSPAGAAQPRLLTDPRRPRTRLSGLPRTAGFKSSATRRCNSACHSSSSPDLYPPRQRGFLIRSSRAISPWRARTAPSRTHVPLGSLTQPGARAGAACRACGSERVTRIAMSLTDGSPVQFTSCHRCEHRTWGSRARGRAVLPVDRVLDKTRKL